MKVKNNNWADTDNKSRIYDLVIIGAGPGGLAAALRAAETGIEDILIIERDSFPGGILPQCIHSGFGLKVFNRELTGPEYNQIFLDRLAKTNVTIMLDTMALELSSAGNGGNGYNNLTAGKKRHNIINVVTAGRATGFRPVQARSVILALGSRERTRGQIMLPGSRPAGVFTAGLVQRMVNIEGYLPGREIVILGSGDIGLIMARRLTLEGCNVKGVYEAMPFSTGLLRNISQCLDDYDIPLYLSHTVSNIIGNRRVEAVEVCPVDAGFKPDDSKAKKIICDTLLLSVGLIPENELSKTCQIAIDEKTGGPLIDEDFMTSQGGIFSCGNSVFIYNIVDEVTEDGYTAAASAADYIGGKSSPVCNIEVLSGTNLVYAVPQRISGKKDVSFKIRARNPLKNAELEIPELGYKKKIKYVNPGEMIFIDIKKEEFSSLKNGKSMTFNISGKKKNS